MNSRRSPADKDKDIAALRDLGIEKELARLSLKQANGDIHQAADIAFTIMNKSDQAEVRGNPSIPHVSSPRHAVIPKSSGESESEEDTEGEGDRWEDVGPPSSERLVANARSRSSSWHPSTQPPSSNVLSPVVTRPSARTASSASFITSSRSSRSKPWPYRLTPNASSSTPSLKRSSSKRSSINTLSTSPPGSSSSRPLSHSVIRSLPLGSLVALGDQKPADKVYKPQKLNEEAAKYDNAASQMVAELFARPNTSLPPSASSTHKESGSDNHRSLRLSFFGRSRDKTHSPTRPAPSLNIPTPAPSISTIPPTPINPSPSVTFEEEEGARGRSSKRLSARSMSPFFARSGRSRSRATSPSSEVDQLRGRQGTSEVCDSDSEDEGDDSESNGEGMTAFIDGNGSEDNMGDGQDWEDDGFDEETELNTDHNAETSMIPSPLAEGKMVPWSDLYQDIEPELGEGPNVVIPAADSYTILQNKPPPSTGLKLNVARPEFGRDRCTIKMEQGDPEDVLEHKGKRQRRYVVASDLSEESGYAVEWAIGTVARDGDELWVVSVQENEHKVDPRDMSSQDRSEKIKVQKERQTLASLLVKQVTPILQRTNLNLTIICQAVHTKNARHMLLDLIDFLEPTIVIVGSRGLGKLKGTILGSMSHYLVQKSSVPVMVARRRLRRNLKRTDPSILRNGARVPLFRANVEKLATGKEQDMEDAADIEREEDLKSDENNDKAKASGAS